MRISPTATATSGPPWAELTLEVAGGTLRGGVIAAPDGVKLKGTATGGVLDAVTLRADLDILDGAANVAFRNGLTLDGATIRLGFDDQLQIGVRCARLGRSSMTMALAIFRGDEHLIDGELVYVYADAHQKKSVAIPAAWRARIGELERVTPDGV